MNTQISVSTQKNAATHFYNHPAAQLKNQKSQITHNQREQFEHDVSPLSQISGEELQEQKSLLGHVGGGSNTDQLENMQGVVFGQGRTISQNISGQMPTSLLSQISVEEIKQQKFHLGHVGREDQQKSLYHVGGESGQIFSDPILHQKEIAAVHHYRKENEEFSPQMNLPPADLSGEQWTSKMNTAQDVLRSLQELIKAGFNTPSGEVLDGALGKAEQFVLQQSQQSQFDPLTRKTLEDITCLIGSAKQLAKGKDLVERLQRISDETAKATQEMSQPGVSVQTREAPKRVVEIVENWRPLFQLLVSSRDFRVLIVDTVQIFRRVLLRHKSFDEKQIEQQFIEGESPVNIAQNVTKDTKESFNTREGEKQVRISDEEFDLLYADMACVLITLLKTPSYRSGLDKIFRLFDIWNSEFSKTASRASKSVQPHARQAQIETKELVASFAGREPLDNFLNSLKRIVERVNQDEKTRQYMYELRQFILDTKIIEQMDEGETKEKLKRFSSEGRELVERYKYADEINDFLDKSDVLVESIKRDDLVSILRQQAGLVVNDLSSFDEQGNMKLDTDMIEKLRVVIAPVIAESLKYIPIPRIEDSDENRDFWVDNIVLCGYDVIPDGIRIQMESDSTINVREIQTDLSETRLILSLNNIKTELKNLDFFYHKKSFPHFSEQGKATLSFPGDGASLMITYILEKPSGSAVVLFRKGLVNFQIHNFEVEFDKETLRHDVLVPMFTTMFKSLIQRKIESSVEKNIGGLVNSIGEQLSSTLMEINKPLMVGLDQMRDVIKGSEVGTVYEKRREILE